MKETGQRRRNKKKRRVRARRKRAVSLRVVSEDGAPKGYYRIIATSNYQLDQSPLGEHEMCFARLGLRLCQTRSRTRFATWQASTLLGGRLVGRQVGWSLSRYIKRSSPPCPPPSCTRSHSLPLFLSPSPSSSLFLSPPHSACAVLFACAASKICGSAFHLIVGTICEDEATTVPIDSWR